MTCSIVCRDFVVLEILCDIIKISEIGYIECNRQQHTTWTQHERALRHPAHHQPGTALLHGFAFDDLGNPIAISPVTGVPVTLLAQTAPKPSKLWTHCYGYVCTDPFDVQFDGLKLLHRKVDANGYLALYLAPDAQRTSPQEVELASDGIFSLLCETERDVLHGEPIGVVAQSSSDGAGGWQVWVMGQLVKTHPTRSAARAHLWNGRKFFMLGAVGVNPTTSARAKSAVRFFR